MKIKLEGKQEQMNTTNNAFREMGSGKWKMF